MRTYLKEVLNVVLEITRHWFDTLQYRSAVSAPSRTRTPETVARVRGMLYGRRLFSGSSTSLETSSSSSLSSWTAGAASSTTVLMSQFSASLAVYFKVPDQGMTEYEILSRYNAVQQPKSYPLALRCTRCQSNILRRCRSLHNSTWSTFCCVGIVRCACTARDVVCCAVCSRRGTHSILPFLNQKFPQGTFHVTFASLVVRRTVLCRPYNDVIVSNYLQSDIANDVMVQTVL